MSLLGPDGQPITVEDGMKETKLHTGNGVPSLDDVPMIPQPVLLDLIKRLEGTLAQGTTLTTPSAVEIGLLCSLVRTIKVQREVLVAQNEEIGRCELTTDTVEE
jgi:hypothetical protein